jgi:D-serine deaminase-like pyridoxal phosphate-dependent protein
VTELGAFAQQIDTPALVVDLDILEANIERMRSFFEGRKARLRPHFKTHKCLEIARKQIAAGAAGMTCAKVSEAEVLVESDIRDILIANQVVGEMKIRRLADLIGPAEITVAVDDGENVADLSAAVSSAAGTLGVLVEIDIGMGRAGVRSVDEATALAERVAGSPGLEFRGLQGYEGHLMLQPPGEEKDRAIGEALGILEQAKAAIERAGMPVREVSGGGTGTYRTTGAHPVMTEVQAGSYVTMDLAYRGVESDFRPALFCLVTIMSRPEKAVAIGDAGTKALAAEFGLPEVVAPAGLGVRKLAEEHTIFDVPADAAEVRVGDKILLMPSHGCTTFNLHDHVHGIRQGNFECKWKIAARGKLT